jgi:hypothetical protein
MQRRASKEGHVWKKNAISAGDIVQLLPACMEAQDCVMTIAFVENELAFGYIAVPIKGQTPKVYLLVVDVNALTIIGHSTLIDSVAIQKANPMADLTIRSKRAYDEAPN